MAPATTTIIAPLSTSNVTFRKSIAKFLITQKQLVAVNWEQHTSINSMGNFSETSSDLFNDNLTYLFSDNMTTSSPINISPAESLNEDDAAWVLLCAFLIFSMQTGFALLEAGCVSSKNVTNIMVKNAVDVMLGGIAYWMFGYALSFGEPATPFCGYGGFFFRTLDDYPASVGTRSAHYFFQLSFSTTSTTIVSGAVAERMKLHAYMIFAFTNTIAYAIPVCWAWNPAGFLYKMGYFDYAGSGIVHLSGGSSALVCAIMLGPRLQRFEEPERYTLSSPVTALTGMFMLWWAWLGFNAGSTFNISDDWWRVSTTAAVITLNGSIGGGLVGLMLSMALKRGKVSVEYLISAVLGGLVAVTGIASVTTTWESLIIGAIGGAIACTAGHVLLRLKIDDPVGAVPVHFCTATWGTLAVGLFGRANVKGQLSEHEGLLRSGSPYLLGVQLLAVVVIALWSALCTLLNIFFLMRTIGFRVSQHDEMLGADIVEHEIHSVTLSERLEAALHKIIAERDYDEAINRLALQMSHYLPAASATINGRGMSASRHRVFTIDVERIEPIDRVRRDSLRDMELNQRVTGNAGIHRSVTATSINGWAMEEGIKPA